MRMEKSVCRALTFINYHIPMSNGIDSTPPYTAIGFFDGFFTEKLEIDYEKEDLKSLWQYTIKKTAENKGYYSAQNIFGFSKDSWNGDEEDEMFWSETMNQKYPLTFVVFLQLDEYVVNSNSVSEQCGKFNKAVLNALNGEGSVYSYITVDKNDFIVCIKCSNYANAVCAIKALHNTGVSVIYSYSVFAMHKDILENIHDSNYSVLYQENIIDSICLKGTINSYDFKHCTTLDQKYREFCDELVRRLLSIEQEDELIEDDEKIVYDILGGDDFRLVVKNVPLGKVMEEYASGGMLCYTGKDFSYYFFSSSMILNTKTGEKPSIDLEYKRQAYEEMQKAFSARQCEQLQGKMQKIIDVVSKDKKTQDERLITFCLAAFQLLQSLKVLEMAPTKKYDFYSLYYPFASLIRILEEKIGNIINIGEYDTIYEFLHAISMTMHGTLRNDIQFSQAKDNVIVHYAPAKLRAFYAIWTLKLADYFKGFGDVMHHYSFIVAPGMYKNTSVKQLFEDYEEQERLMLITIPERHLYAPKWLAIAIAHEIPHFAGYKARNRESRHALMLQVCARIFELELHAFMYRGMQLVDGGGIEADIREKDSLLKPMRDKLIEREKIVRKECEAEYKPYQFHSKYSIIIIIITFYKTFDLYLKQIIYDYTANIQNGIYKRKVLKDSPVSEQIQMQNVIRQNGNSVSDEMLEFSKAFLDYALKENLEKVNYIMSENFADVMAIITLELSPTAYVRSLVRMEYGSYEMQMLEDDELSFIVIRISFVVESIRDMVKRHRNWIKKESVDFAKMWSGDVLSTLLTTFLSDSLEYKIIKETLEYRKCRKNLEFKISSYERLYNEKTRKFENTCSYLLDEKVWALICQYLSGCIDMYIQELKEHEELREKKKEISQSYKRISGNIDITMIQEIEEFLAQNEDKFHEVY